MSVYITQHAVLRIEERTKLALELVKEVLENQAYHPIGQGVSKEGASVQYAVFYSHSDGRCFVAVIDPTSDSLLTVLKEEHYISGSIQVRPFHCKQARQKWSQFAFGRMFGGGDSPETVGEAFLEVLSGGKKHYKHALGPITREQVTARGFLEHFQSILLPLVEAAASWRKKTESKKVIRFELWARFDLEKTYKNYLSFHHPTLRGRLEKLKKSSS